MLQRERLLSRGRQGHCMALLWTSPFVEVKLASRAERVLRSGTLATTQCTTPGNCALCRVRAVGGWGSFFTCETHRTRGYNLMKVSSARVETKILVDLPTLAQAPTQARERGGS